MTREPLPHEAHLFAEVYIDESSQNDHHFLVLGGIVIPRRLSAQFEADIINARSPRLPAVINSKGQLKEIGWKYISNGDFDAYKKVVDAYFSFAFRHLQNSMDPMHFYCSIIDTQIRGRRYTGKRGKFGLTERYITTASASPGDIGAISSMFIQTIGVLVRKKVSWRLFFLADFVSHQVTKEIMRFDA